MEQQNSSKFSLWRQRIGYGSADFACNLIWQMISLYLLFFYTDIMQLNAASISLMFVITRIIDGVTDLLVGYAIDRTHTRWGQSRPYFLFGAVPFALFAVLAFTVPNLSGEGRLIYAFVTYIGLSFMYTVVNIPLASVLPALSSDAQERTNLSTARKFFGFLGAGVVSACSFAMVEYLGGGNEAQGYHDVMLIFGIVGCLIFFFTFASIREIGVSASPAKVTLSDALRSLKANRPWQIFAFNILFMWTGFFLQTGALIYYFKYYVGSTALAATVASMMSIVPMAVNFLVPYLAKRLGKCRLFLWSAAVQLLGLAVLWAGGRNELIILAGAFVMAAGYGAKESIYFSIQADPVDYGEWKTGVNTAGTLSSINGFLGKCAQAAAGGLAGLLFAVSGYDGSLAVQGEEAIWAIQAMYVYLPAILLVFSMLTMSRYNLDEEYPRIKAELDARRQQEDVDMNEAELCEQKG
ncbi:MFS transporter [Selenomonas ruminantium]|uniref:MFS transporter n=1 Tax=Selenomonas ruminantium TaxID=971 RepID=UPI0003FE65CC|nr:MFS transporter [Selenomonas ruminantium]